jgi:hypothetical protein
MTFGKATAYVLVTLFLQEFQAGIGFAQSAKTKTGLQQPREMVRVGSCLSRVSNRGSVTRVQESFQPTDSPSEQAERELDFFRLALPGILEQHARMEFFMWRKHLYGTIYGEPPPLDNPLLTTEKDIGDFLDSVVEAAAPGGILVYWRSQPERRSDSDLCVGLALPFRRMLVEASPLSDQEKLNALLTFDRVTDARVATPRTSPSKGSPIQQAPTRIDLNALSSALLPPSIARALEQHRVKSLLIIPIEGIGGVPFAALPLQSGSTLIDYSSVTVAPGFEGLDRLGSSDITISSKDKDAYSRRSRPDV